MHVRGFKIVNIRGIEQLEWRLSLPTNSGSPNALAGWHVMIGDNGAGKSTVLRALALAIIGARDAEALREDWSSYIHFGRNVARVDAELISHFDDDLGGWPVPETSPPLLRPALQISVVHLRPELREAEGEQTWRHNQGFFAASFGPFRRFRGGDRDDESVYRSRPRLARHLSVFGENVALTECLAWLRQLKFEELDRKAQSGRLLQRLTEFVNQEGFLPQGTKFKGVDSQSVQFVDGRGQTVAVEVLGDGFRSILSLTFELLRQMALTWPDSELFEEGRLGLQVRHSGVVLIDEIDAHLHPTWQRQIGHWLTRHFPKVQFIVTTHSPLVCQAAEHGSIFRLPTPGTSEQARMVGGLERERLIFGSVLDAYGTELFGSDVSRSKSAKKKQQRLAELNQKILLEPAKLSAEEQQERTELQALFPASM